MSADASPIPPLTIAHVAGDTRRYPGETVTFFTRVQAAGPWTVAPVTVRVKLPPELALEDCEAGHPDAGLPIITQGEGETNAIWTLAEPDPSIGYEFEVKARVSRMMEERTVLCRASASAPGPGGKTVWVEETASVAVARQGRYLRHLPAIYQDDELMGRLLMLFESFWGPIEGQVADLSLYFDPRLTPPGMLPWLASWLDLVLDDQWPDDRRRLLLRSAAVLFRKRGTRQGLEEYLTIYAGVRPRIIEHRAHNLRLGAEARLGPSSALGTANVPHSFTVVLPLPAGQEADPRFTRRIQAIIDAQKPAHTTYVLRIENDGSRNA